MREITDAARQVMRIGVKRSKGKTIEVPEIKISEQKQDDGMEIA